MIEEEYRGYNLNGVRRGGTWQVSIYPRARSSTSCWSCSERCISPLF